MEICIDTPQMGGDMGGGGGLLRIIGYNFGLIWAVHRSRRLEWGGGVSMGR